MMYRPVYNVRPIKDLKDMLIQSERLYGDNDAFLLKTSDDTYKGISYRHFKGDVDSLGTALQNLGFKGCTIAVISENRYEWCVTYLAVSCGAGVIVPLDKELPGHEIENLLLRSKAAVVVFSGKLENEVRKSAENIPGIRHLVNMDLPEDRDGMLSFRRLVEKGKELLASGDRYYINTVIDTRAMDFLIFTSGTTDLAKGVMLTHENLAADVMAVCSTLYIDDKDSVLSILPLHHTYECTAGFLVMIYNGCTISFNEGLKHIAKNLKETRPTILILVPLIIENMYKKVWEAASKQPLGRLKLRAAMFAGDLLFNVFGFDIRKNLFKPILDNVGGRLRLIVAGAAAINPKVSKGFRSMGILTLQGYGLTECSPIVTANREKGFRDDSIGQPLPGVEVEIDAPDAEGIGEIKVRGDIVMPGYYENPQATGNILKDGWLYTGDLGRVDREGNFYITGRKKNVIVTKNGKNIFPEEVEAYLNDSPYILESMVYGRDIEETGETEVCAVIVPDFEMMAQKLRKDAFTPEETRAAIENEVKTINRKMPLYKHIRAFTIREDELVKTTTRKIKRYLEKVH